MKRELCVSPAQKACAQGDMDGGSASPFRVGWSQQVNGPMLTETEVRTVREAGVSVGLGRRKGPRGVGLELEKQTQHPHPWVWVG